MIDNIWWEQVGSSRLLLSKIVTNLRNGCSFVLHLHSPLPWPLAFEQCLLRQSFPYRENRQYHQETVCDDSPPEEFLMERYCTTRFAAGYWPSLSVGEYLCTDPEQLIHECILHIHGIRSVKQLKRWCTLVADYGKWAKKLPTSAIFILEYEGSANISTALPVISYDIRSYDCHLFCLEAAYKISGSEWFRQYTAELALQLGNNDPECCAALISDKNVPLAKDPIASVPKLLKNTNRSSGIPFEVPHAAQIKSCVWKAQVIMFFPEIEQRRNAIIAHYEDALASYLPINNSNNETIYTTAELELGNIYFLMTHHPNQFDSSDIASISFYRRIRNDLAHLDPLNYADLQRLMKQRQ